MAPDPSAEVPSYRSPWSFEALRLCFGVDEGYLLHVSRSGVQVEVQGLGFRFLNPINPKP